MIVIRGNTVWFDVDDTLILWNPPKDQLESRGIDITCPKSMTLNDDGELVDCGSWTTKVVPHRVHVEQLKKHKLRGHKVIVWSAGGEDWAEAAVKALKLEDFVDIVVEKPSWIYDDIKPEDFMPRPYWMKDEEN